MGERVDFGRRARPPAGRSVYGMGAVLLVVVALLATRPWWAPRAPDGVLIEVRGEVPRPGVHALPAPTLAGAVEAAGGDAAGLPDTPLHAGDRVIVSADGVRVAPSGDPLLVALPVDLNTTDAAALEALPGIGPSLAAAIVADRAARGPFARTEEVARVKGVGPSLSAELAPFLTVSGVEDLEPPGPVDLNTASAAALEALPGIGPVTAARIVVDRDERGPFRSIDDLARVKGIGPKTVARLRDEGVVASQVQGGGGAGGAHGVDQGGDGGVEVDGVGADGEP